MAGLKIKKGDHVVVLTGKDKGKRGEVLKVLPAEDRAVVQGVAQVRRHQRQTASQEGGIITKEARSIFPISRLRTPRTGNPRRVGYKFLKDGRKVRFAKRSGEVIDG
ncbi:50S ribosomal protein L24 [Methyloceanibacter methanicus]|uniref:50S ribosomal protein L24 n=1 Tax=Methyloceanibacter methanicus TaxID=1774968 RepID=UPI000B269937|nr:50S ribosomal protein L24 [Methyloceanibacter methanicus]